MNIVLFEPEIPPNTGTIGRSCVGTNTKLHLIKPLGFKLDNKQVKRAGMDYWKHVSLFVYDDYEDFTSKNKDAKIFYATTKTKRIYTQVEYEKDCYIMFGKESGGIPQHILNDNEERCITIPMTNMCRSLNLSNSASIILYEALRQNDFYTLNR